MSATIAEQLADRIVAIDPARLPQGLRTKCDDLLIDVIGLCVTARNEDYVTSTLNACDDDGPCTAIGHKRRLSAAGAALVNGTAAHGEDFDDTFEGGPVHAGAVIVPAVLAACERHNPDGQAALLGIAVGSEVMCRLSLVAPKAIHRAGFHPTAVLGAVAAAAGAAAALGCGKKEIVNALGISGSMASGIIEYLAEGSWTKRMHAGWAAQSGLRAALLGRNGFAGPRTVFEGTHGLFHGFAHSKDGNYGALADDFGKRWVIETLAFKPYPCGTMAHPFIDCARRLGASGIKRRRDRGDGLRNRRGNRASAVGAAGPETTPAERLCGEVLDPLLHRRGLPARQCRARFIFGSQRKGSGRGGAGGESALRDRSEKSLSR